MREFLSFVAPRFVPKVISKHAAGRGLAVTTKKCGRRLRKENPNCSLKFDGRAGSDLSRSNETIDSKFDWIADAVSKHGYKEPPNSHSQFALRLPKQPFFEGWYYRLTLPNTNVSYAFIFAIEAPNIGCIQVIDALSNLHYVQLPSDSKFQASKNQWSFSHWGYTTASTCGGSHDRIMEGWTVDSRSCHGRIKTGNHGIQWAFDYDATLGWGPRGQGRHTGTWLARFPLFEPGYQVLMAHGIVSKGYITLGDESFDVTGSVVYAEKNWGRSFPPKWFWMQANSFWNIPDLSVLAVGAIRNVVVVDEVVGMICVHYKGEMYEFSNWNCVSVDWNVEWGKWIATSLSRNGCRVEVCGSTKDGCSGVPILGPTRDGMAFTMRDTMCGNFRVKLLDAHGEVIVEAECKNAQLEVGGEPWGSKWCSSVLPLPQPLLGIVNLFNGPKVKTSS